MNYAYRYLYVEYEDTTFGLRAGAVHTRLTNTLASSSEASQRALAAISEQIRIMAQLKHVSNELKVRSRLCQLCPPPPSPPYCYR